jgi:hypothetical protein
MVPQRPQSLVHFPVDFHSPKTPSAGHGVGNVEGGDGVVGGGGGIPSPTLTSTSMVKVNLMAENGGILIKIVFSLNLKKKIYIFWQIFIKL